MPSLTAEDHVSFNDFSEVDEKLPRSESPKSDAGDSEWQVDDEESDGVVQSDYGANARVKTDNTDKPKNRRAVIGLDRHVPGASATTIQPFAGSDYAVDKNNEAATTEKERTLKCMGEDGKCLKEKNKVSDSSKDPEKTKDGGSQKSEVVNHASLDGGWAFLVLLGSFIIMTVIGILGPCFGILFTGFLTEMNATSTVAAALFNTESFIWSSSNLLAGPLTEQYGWRAITAGGGVLCCIGMAASAFAPSASFLFFSHAILTGFGSGACTLVGMVIIPYYFKRLLGRASAITSSGMCVGGIIGPPVVTYLQEQFGFKGATLIVAAFTLHLCFAAALYRPVQRPSEVRKAKESKMKPETTLPGLCQVIKQMVYSLGRNCKLLKSPEIAMISFGGCFVVGAYLNLSMLVPFIMEAKGHTQETAAWCMSVANLCNFACRLLVASCSDLPNFNKLGVYIIFATLMSATTIAFIFVQEVTWVTVVLAMWGSGVGACISLYPIILVHYAGVQQYMAILGVSGVTNGVWMLCSGTLLGVISDYSGSYTVTVCVIGASGFITVLFYLLLPVVVAYDKRKEDQQRAWDAEKGGESLS